MVKYSEFNESDHVKLKQTKELVDQYYGYPVNSRDTGVEWRDIRFDMYPDGSIKIVSDCHLATETTLLPILDIKECIGDFSCTDRKLASLQYSPKMVRGNFDCAHNPLKSLLYGPSIVDENYFCKNCELESLQYSPKIIYGGFHCAKNNLENLKYCPDTIGGVFDCTNNPFKSLEGLDHTKNIKGPIHLRYNPSLPLLRVLVIEKGVYFDDVTPIEALINEFVKSDLTLKEKIYQCQYAMIKSGFKGNAKW